MHRITVEIDPARLTGRYKDSHGIVSYFNESGEIYYQRMASDVEALAESRHREIVGLLRQLQGKESITLLDF